MKILALGDPHGILPKNLNSIIKKNKIDVIVCVGDIGFTPEKPWLDESWKNVPKNYAEKTYRKIVNKLCSYKLPVLTLRGNMFMMGKTKKIADKILNKNNNLLNRFTGKIKIGDVVFILFDISYESETEHKARNKRPQIINAFNKRRETFAVGRSIKLNKMLSKNPNAILICHNPPYGFVDKAYNGKNVGSKIILNAIKKNKPKLVLCGHIHEAKGEAKIGKTKVYNLGCRGDYKILEV